MKARVIEVLAAFSAADIEKHAMAQLLKEELAVDDDVLQKRAQQTLKHMLHHYSDISISTIDHFTHNVIRTFAQDLGLSINFEVELDTDRITDAIVYELMHEMETNPMLTDALIDVVKEQIDDEKSWTIDDLLRKFAATLFNEDSRLHLEQLKNIELKEFNALRKKLRSQLRNTTESLKKSGQEFIDLLAQNGVEAKHFAGGSKGLPAYFKKLSIGKFDQPTSTVLKNMAADKWHSTSAKEHQKASIDALKPRIIENYQRTLAQLSKLTTYHIVFNQIYNVALLDEMQRIQRALQHEEEVLHIGEFNHLVSNVVMTETAPFIYERIGHRFKHFLVDEFQDTSVLQWFNLLPLIDESLAHNNLCLVVGDAKQSIYRWRGGDVQQFVKLPAIHTTRVLKEQLEQNTERKELLNQRQAALIANEQVENLAFNYRSSATVVNFNNAFFSWLKPQMPEELRTMYDENEQQPISSKEGFVSVQFFRQENKEPTWLEYDNLVLEQVLEWVQNCIDDGYKLGDIAIICRGNKELVKTAQFLLTNKINVVSNESLLINSSAKVRLLINIAAFVSSPEDHTNIAELIQHLGMARNETDRIAERFMQVNKREKHTETRALLHQLYPHLNLSTLKHKSLFGVFDHLKHALFPEMQDAYLTFFMDEVLRFSSAQTNDLAEFLTHWKEKRDKLSIALSENREAIRLLTIHKSKGLEFPIVMHPFADYKSEAHKNSIWVYTDDDELKPLNRLRVKAVEQLAHTPFSQEYEQEKASTEMEVFNMLYVALTRPVSRLYISGKLKKSNTKNPAPSTAIQFVYEYLKSIDTTVANELRYETGKSVKILEEEQTAQKFSVQPVGNPFWQERIRISQPSKDRWKTSDPSDARNLGILIHDAMANIRTSKDIDTALSLLVEDGRISVSETAELAGKIQNLLSNTALSPLYSEDKQIRNEVDIQLSNGKWVRPDRVVLSANQAWILDYKTGVELRKHHQQMNTYKQALFELGFKHVDAFLVYIEEERVVRCA